MAGVAVGGGGVVMWLGVDQLPVPTGGVHLQEECGWCGWVWGGGGYMYMWMMTNPVVKMLNAIYLFIKYNIISDLENIYKHFPSGAGIYFL